MSQEKHVHVTELLKYFFTETQAEYPKLKNEFVLIDLPRGEVLTTFDLSKYGNLTHENFMEAIGKSAQASIKINSSCAGKLQVEDQGLTLYLGHVIVFNETTLPEMQNSYEQLFTLHVLYHERGHLVVKDALGPRDESHFKEIAADIYSLAVFEKKHGGKACNYITDSIMVNTTQNFVGVDDRTHMSLFAVQEFIRIKSTLDFKAMTLDDIETLAWRFAAKHSLPDFVLERISAEFADYRKEVKENADGALERLCDKMVATADPMVYAIGRKYLSTSLRKDIAFSKDAAILVNDATKARIEAKLRQKDWLDNSTGVTAGMPLKAPQVPLKLKQKL